MNRHWRLGLLVVAIPLAMWVVAHWYYSQFTHNEFIDGGGDSAAHGLHQWVNAEWLDDPSTETGESRVLVRFVLPSLRDTFGTLPLRVKRSTGPVFFSQNGVTFGAIKWRFYIEDHEDVFLPAAIKPLLNQSQPLLTVSLDLFNRLHYDFFVPHFRWYPVQAKSLRFESWGKANGQQAIRLTAKSLQVNSGQSHFELPTLILNVQRSIQAGANETLSDDWQLSVEPTKGDIGFGEIQKKLPLMFSAQGATDLQQNTLNGHLNVQTRFMSKQGEYLLRSDFQFTDWLKAGLAHFWTQQRHMSSLLDQAQWALEDGAETPEEQAFVMSLYQEAARFRGNQDHHALRAMNIDGQSQLSIDVKLTQGQQLLAEWVAIAKPKPHQQELVTHLKGKARAYHAGLGKARIKQLDQLSHRYWFKAYETFFESDVVLRDQQLLLNSIRVSWEHLGSELKQILTDQ